MAVDDPVSFIASSFWPQYFLDNGEMLTEFVKIYYEYLEQPENVLWYARQHVQNRDIDKTIDPFLAHFKAKYLPDVQLDTFVETRDMVKQSLPFYRARGTDNSFQLFFREVFGVEATVYRPWDDVFMLSSGNWVRDQYLEISPFSNNAPLIGQEIVGLQSGATAFVDRYVRRVLNQRKVDVYYISAINGTFATGEQLCLASNVNVVNAPTVVGSMTGLYVVEGSESFNVGDIVDVTSNTGIQGKARVSSVQSATGLIDFNFVDGGWGYGPNLEVYISNYEMYVSNVARPATFMYTSIQLLDQVVQPLCQIQYAYGNGYFHPQDTISIYNGSHALIGQGTVLSTLVTNSTSGNLFCSITSGDLSLNTVYYNQGNAVSANLIASGYTNLTANGLLLNIPLSNVTVNFGSATGLFSNGAYVYQVDSGNNVVFYGYINQILSIQGTSGSLSLTNCITIPFTGVPLYSTSSNNTMNVTSLGFNLGLQSNSTYTSDAGNFCYDNSFFNSGVIQSIATGYGASFGIANTRYNIEETSFSTNPIFPELNVPLDATTYGPNLNNANLFNMTLSDALTFETANIGSIVSLVGINPGQEYVVAPYVLVVDPNIAYFYERDYIFTISSSNGAFTTGEIISQAATGAKGLVKYANTTTVGVRRIQFENNWVANNFANSWLILGDSSGVSATLLAFASDISSSPIGSDAVITANVTSSPGVVSSLQVIASGFGFNQSSNNNGVAEDLVTFTSQDGSRSGTAFGILNGQGTSAGYYKDRNGFLSSTKKLTDSYFYTPYSYEVQTSVSPNQYLTMLQKLLHAAGKMYFTAVYRDSIMNMSVGIEPVTMGINDGFALNIRPAIAQTNVGQVGIQILNVAIAHATAHQFQPFAYQAMATATIGPPVKWIQIWSPSASCSATAHSVSIYGGSNTAVMSGSVTATVTTRGFFYAKNVSANSVSCLATAHQFQPFGIPARATAGIGVITANSYIKPSQALATTSAKGLTANVSDTPFQALATTSVHTLSTKSGANLHVLISSAGVNATVNPVTTLG